ncbi:uncharacterized protein BDV17DRAFT_289044 [Aspergillus undulatus]|uniref:uncharacterized protein n=1 Tax=Aspergillus undulatus TaxID=1810928 RepID=UPI003CCD995B
MAIGNNHHLGLLNTSWTCHRLSPLHHGPLESGSGLLTSPTALTTYATRLRDHLTNSLAGAGAGAGVGIGAGDDEPATAVGVSALGALQSCTWEPISTLDFLQRGKGVDVDDAIVKKPAGLFITLAYESITYRAALLAPQTGNTSGTSRSSQTQPQAQPQKRKRGRPSMKSTSNLSSISTTLPLLLTRLPKPLRESFLSFLSSNFDTYASPLRISSAGLAGLLEGYVDALSTPAPASGTAGAGGESGSQDQNETEEVGDIIKELHLTLTFAPPIAPSLRGLNVSIPRETFGVFLRDSKMEGKGSVLEGLSRYLQKHLAMELGLPLPSSAPLSSVGENSGNASLVGGYVRLTRIACAGFVLTSEGRLKIVGNGKSRNGSGEDEEVTGRGRNEGALTAGGVLLRGVLERAAGVSGRLGDDIDGEE